MKKQYYLLLIVLGLSIIGCSNSDDDQMLQETPLDLETVEMTIEDAYIMLKGRAFMSRSLGIVTMLRSDMVDIANPNTAVERVNHDQFTVSPDDPFIYNDFAPHRGFWYYLYQIIDKANVALQEIELLEEQDPGIREELEGRARFIRAFTYYHLVRLFGDLPYKDENTTIEEFSIMSRTPVNEVYENIIADLEFAKAWLPNTRTNRALPAKTTAGAYLASVHLTIGNYQRAYEEATGVINNAGAYDLALEPDYRNVFHAENTDNSLEPIFILDFVATDAEDELRDYLAAFTGFYGQATYYPSGGWSVMTPAMSVYETWDDGDYRKSVNFDDYAMDSDGNELYYTEFSTVDIRNVNRPHISKYTAMAGDLPQANTNGRNSHSNYQLMRFAEVLLIAAEAAIEIGQGAEADQLINMVRERARNGDGIGTPSAIPVDISGATIADVLEERRLELAFEQKRWYDIVRREIGNEVFGANGFETAYEGTQNFDPSRDYLLPIPAMAITANPNLTQNSGY